MKKNNQQSISLLYFFVGLAHASDLYHQHLHSISLLILLPPSSSLLSKFIPPSLDIASLLFLLAIQFFCGDKKYQYFFRFIHRLLFCILILSNNRKICSFEDYSSHIASVSIGHSSTCYSLYRYQT